MSQAGNVFIDEKEARELLVALLQAPSVNPPGDTTAPVRVLGAYLDRLGIPWRVLTAEGGRANLVAELAGAEDGPTLLLNGHIDVVAAGEGWTVDPFAGVGRDGLIYGRGASDMKGGVAAMALALGALKRSGGRTVGKVLLMAVADEETGGALGTGFLLGQGIGVGADFAIVGEPTDSRVELGNRGVAWLEVEVRGKAGHPGRPAHAANAVHYAGRLVHAIAEMKFERRDERFEVPTPSVSVTMIEGGVKANVIPDRCTLTIDRRLLPGESAEGAMEEIRRLIQAIPAPGVTAVVHRRLAWEPYLIPDTSPVVTALARAHEAVTGAAPRLGAKGGATDGSHLYHVGGVSTAIYGPGNPARAHAVDEFVALDDVVRAARVYAGAALELLGPRG